MILGQILVLGIVVHIGLTLEGGDFGTWIEILMLIIPSGILIDPAHALTIFECLQNLREWFEGSSIILFIRLVIQ